MKQKDEKNQADYYQFFFRVIYAITGCQERIFYWLFQ